MLFSCNNLFILIIIHFPFERDSEFQQIKILGNLFCSCFICTCAKTCNSLFKRVGSLSRKEICRVYGLNYKCKILWNYFFNILI